MATPRILPIADLSTMVPRWMIKGRVVDKSGLQSFNRSGGGGQGRLFSVDIMDVRGDTVRAKFWGDAADKFMGAVSKGNVYTFRNGRVAVANKRYSNLPHNYEVTFDTGSEIVLVPEDGSDQSDCQAIPKQRKCNFTTLRDVKNSTRDMPFLVDIMGVVHETRPCETVQSKKDATTLYKRDIKLVDSSQHVLPVTLWGQWAQIEDSKFEGQPVVAVQNLQIREWRGRVGQSGMNTQLDWPSTSAEAETVKEWYTKHKHESHSWANFSDPTSVLGTGTEGRRPIEEKKLSAIMEDLESLDLTEPRMYSFYAVPTRIMYKNRNGEFNALYPACPSCKKKVLVDEPTRTVASQTARCETCDKEVAPDYRYMFGVSFADETCGGSIVRAFHEAGVELLKMPGAQLHDMSVSSDPDENSKVAEAFEFDSLWGQKCKVTIRAGLQSYNGEERKNVTVVNLERVDCDIVSRLMLNKIKSDWLPNATAVSESRKTKKDASSPSSPPTATSQSTTTPSASGVGPASQNGSESATTTSPPSGDTALPDSHSLLTTDSPALPDASHSPDKMGHDSSSGLGDDDDDDTVDRDQASAKRVRTAEPAE